MTPAANGAKPAQKQPSNGPTNQTSESGDDDLPF
jgi:hypothetical protein